MDSAKKHRLTLKGHAEDVTDAELASIKKTLGSRFSEYTVEPIQPAAPAELATTHGKSKAKDADAAAA